MDNMQSKASKYAKCIASDQGYQVSAEKQNLLSQVRMCRDATVYRERFTIACPVGIVAQKRAEPRAIERYVSVLTPSVVSKPKKVSAICENEICKMTCSN